MRHGWLLMAAALLALPALAQDDDAPVPEVRTYELKVVGVYRPLALKGRTIKEAREVYLQPLKATGPIDALVGETLQVHRKVPVPALVDFAVKPKAKKAAKVKARKKKKKRRLTRAELRQLAEEKAAAAKIAAAAAKAKKAAPVVESVAPPAVVAVKTAPIETRVAAVKVVAVRSGVVVAHAVDAEGESLAVGGAVPAVMAGDVARLEVTPPPPPPPPSLSPKEQGVLDADRQVTEKEDHRRRNPPKKYRRAKTRWKL